MIFYVITRNWIFFGISGMDVEKWLGLMINFFEIKLLMGFWRVKKKDDEGFRCDFEIKITIFGRENWNLRRNTEIYGKLPEIR